MPAGIQPPKLVLGLVLFAILVTFEQPINANETDDSGYGPHGSGKIIPCNIPHQPDYQPNIYDCTSFFVCVGPFYRLLHCPSGLYFNSQNIQCDWPHKVDCRPSKATAAAASTPRVKNAKKKICQKSTDRHGLM